MPQSFHNYDDLIRHLNKNKKLTFQGKHIISNQRTIKNNGRDQSIHMLLFKLFYNVEILIVCLKKTCDP